MRIALDMSPLKSGHYLQHRVRGTGFYLRNLQESLEKYFPENEYVYFSRGSLSKDNIDIIHYPYFEPYFLTLPIFSKFKKVVTVHDLTPLVFPSHFKSGLKGWSKWQIQKLALKNSDAIITDSQSSKNDIIKFAGIDTEKITVVYLAAGSEFKRVNSKEKIENVKRKYNLPEKFILYVGDATWNKNLPRLISAVNKINKPLVLVGQALVDSNIDLQNPWNKDLVAVQKMAEGNKNIYRLGFISSDDLVALYGSAALFVMPSIYEGFGLPILEAMSCGCPVVASNGGSLPEIVGKAGRYVDPYDVNDITKGISEVFNDLKLQIEFSQKGITQANKFTWKKTASETIDVYRSVMR
jgi:glycosyltransferase involved in cell wall biosynthesis